MRSTVHEMLRRRMPQVLGIYLAAGWGLLEFSDWAVNRFQIQTNVVGLVLLSLAAFLIPVLWIAWRVAGDVKEPLEVEAPPRSVAVLPFVSVGDDPEAELLGFGIADQILSDLTRIGDLRVVARTSSFAYRGVSEDVRKIGRKLGARAILEGSVQRSGNRLRVTTQLVSAQNGYHLWSESYDRAVEDLFAIEDEIAANVARVLNAVLREHERRAITKVPTRHVEAMEFYLRGRRFLFQTRRRSLEFAREMFQRAIDVDPDFAQAYAGIADVAALLGMYFPAARANLDEGLEAAERALSLDPELAEAHAAMGAVHFVSGRIPAAERAFERAAELDPRLFEARYFHARACFQEGRFQQAAKLYREATEVREDYASSFFLAQSLEAMGEEEEAREAYQEAVRVVERYMDLNPDDPRAATMRAVALSRVGRTEEGLHWAERALSLDPADAGVRYNAACLFSVAGRTDRALECLEEAVEVGFGNPDWLARDPDLDNIRDEPQFQALMSRMQGQVDAPAT
ncbi:MAG: tetratricopeptide repeat protein [Gemmatimonadales bacterium]|jgi:TolB-like protein/Flp pilus assembly protein TadD|nr:MAG: tetratricopeptide repeat protein [Gemmatimonadales bacterium]